jgi:hypothetical protein
MEDAIMKLTGLIVAIGFVTLAVGGGAAAGGDLEFTADFPLDTCKFKASGKNPYFSLRPGYQLLLEGLDEDEIVTLQITVLTKKKTIKFYYNGEEVKARTRVVEEREWADGELIEVSRNYFARCKRTNDIYYFGEDVDIYEDGEIVSHEGAWLAGVDGALPGLIMSGNFLLGSRYFQELAPDIALDRAEHVEMGVTVETLAGTFDDCVIVFEDSALEPDADSEKIYCPGVGLVQDDELTLIWYGWAGDDDDDSDDDGN